MGLALCLFVAWLIYASNSQSNVPLKTSKGAILGLRWDPHPKTRASYDAFLGIPYGTITKRFLPAVSTSSWNGTKMTQSDGPACPQPNMPYSEDCLYLNVFTPVNAANSSVPYPVVAFIHGSAFTLGSSSSSMFGPDFIVPYDVILVTMNYRLGAAGFLSLGSSEAPGNLGLWDTQLALRWVQEEILHFGGDPGRVTLAGHSAGSAMTMFNYLSNTSSAMFHRAIAHSGSALATWAHVTPAEAASRAKQLAGAVGCDQSLNNTQLLTCLQSANISAIVNHQNITLPVESVVSGNQLPFVPVIDTSFGNSVFFTDSIENLLKEAANRYKPLVTGFTTEEGLFLLDMGLYKQTEANLGGFVPWRLQSSLSDREKSSLGEKIANKYYTNTVDQNKVMDAVYLYTDYCFAYPAIDVMKFLPNITYGYIFSYNGAWTVPFPSMVSLHVTGVYHGADMNYIFYMGQDVETCTSNRANLAVRDHMVQWWTSFVKNGTLGAWRPISDGRYLLINSGLSWLDAPVVENHHYNFWANMSNGTHYNSAT